MATRAYKPRNIPVGSPLYRIPKVLPGPHKRSVVLADNHAAIREARTLFPSTVTHPSLSPSLFVSGHNSRKTGGRVVKGRWRGMPIYTLTLEERATCPRSCAQWLSCYGNNMHLARRHIAGRDLEQLMRIELRALAARHPGGFVVRLHILGDFYSVGYVHEWAAALAELPALHVFGYTAREMDGAIGAAVLDINARFRRRARIRFSGADAAGLGALVIDRAEDSRHVICPAQTDATDCCGTCGLCWTMNRPIEFLRH